MDIDALLQQFELFGVKLGLESSQQLLANLDNPHEQVPIIHVAGSNGKGSVCAYLSSVLTEAGYRVGRYTSPHLIHWCERICLNGEAIAPEALEEVLQQVIAAVPSDQPSPTQFEIITAAAWLYFAQQEVDIAVIEVGLGGRLDATNMCDYPLVTIITSISLEHWQRLGPTLADIAFEKAGILKSGCPTVIGQLPPEAVAVIHRRIGELSCPTVFPRPAKDLGNGWARYHSVEVEDLHPEDPEDEEIVQVETTIDYRLPLQGAIQLHNSALAIAALCQLRQQGWQILDEAIANGIAKTQWPGRLQWFTWCGYRILVDGAHNPASAEVLRQFVESPAVGEYFQAPVHWVIGMLSTKDHADIFKAVLRSGDRLYVVPVPGHSSADPTQLVDLAQDICPGLAHCQAYADEEAGLTAATQTSGGQELTVLCGSLYLLGHFLAKVRS